MKEMSSIKVCVVGAGPSALSLLHFLKDSPSVDVHVYERQGEVGGMWTCLDSWRVGMLRYLLNLFIIHSLQFHFFDRLPPGTDQFGLPCHHSMYKDLWSNGPKEGLEYPDYTFQQHFGKTIGSFPPRRVLKA